MKWEMRKEEWQNGNNNNSSLCQNETETEAEADRLCAIVWHFSHLMGNLIDCLVIRFNGIFAKNFSPFLRPDN